MQETLGSLGNLEIQIVLKRNRDKQIVDLINQMPLKLLDVYFNNWGEGKSTEIEFDPSLFSALSAQDKKFFSGTNLGIILRL